MSQDLNNLDIKALPALFAAGFAKLGRYSALLFLLLVAAVYGFIVFRINTLSNAEPADSTVSAKVESLSPGIDAKVVSQLQTLQDNSVSVKSLFDDARSNPFSE